MLPQTANLAGRSLLTLSDFTPDEIRHLLTLAHSARADRRAGVIHQRFRGKSLAMLYQKRSTRTRSAFETAFGEEGGHAVFFTDDELHLGAKESLADTARVMGRMFDAIQFRGFEQRTAVELARHAGIPVYNGLTDSRHPTQVLADLMTLEAHFERLQGLTLAYVGDASNNIASSLMIGCALVGVNFISIGPAELPPEPALFEACQTLAAAAGSTLKTATELRQVGGADAIYTDVWVSMGWEGKERELVELLRPFQVDQRVMASTDNAHAVFMHDLPAVKGNEVSEEVFEGEASLVWEQAENRKHTAKAVMLATLGVPAGE
jgi:ornithine carbamoyltransferase